MGGAVPTRTHGFLVLSILRTRLFVVPFVLLAVFRCFLPGLETAVLGR
jgi:hypothetical protein